MVPRPLFSHGFFSAFVIAMHNSVQYHNLGNFSINATGYASANLRLMSVEYNLFEKFPLDFCGSWVQTSNYSDGCPGWDGVYSFNIPYTLPSDDDDITTWFATGWQGVSDLEVHSSDSEDSTPLSYCQMYWNTYVTPSEVEGWKTMPSSAQTGIIVGSVLALVICCCCYSICCRRRKRHVTDVGYYDHDDEADYQKYEEKGQRGGRQRSRSPNGRRVDSVEDSRAQ